MPKSSVRSTRSPPATSSGSPSHMLTNSILIQSDAGRKFDSSIQYNRIIDDPFQRSSKSPLKSLMALFITIAVFACLLLSENMGFSSLSLAVTDRKYFGRKPNIGNNSTKDSSSGSDHVTEDGLTVVDDDADDELRGTEDDDTRGVDPGRASFESKENDEASDSNDSLRATEDDATRDIDVNASIENKANNSSSSSNDGLDRIEEDDAQNSDENDTSAENTETIQSNDSNDGPVNESEGNNPYLFDNEDNNDSNEGSMLKENNLLLGEDSDDERSENGNDFTITKTTNGSLASHVDGDDREDGG
mmetsp:Transcript_13811/g.30065  ORF Transcript_13811/g.30065 Transcript_13811/m.30065 type:complete len:304 (-) Transcript_13811:686-1597(-)|eukprot:CAMPEP_0172320504 /NCGR_PEP_ID=MMETSP1058-20130122/40691_1 /TAXON_ID=83371 /ORGANISM="Detonula confervacea, Strain CCMP 353" /LENGTH=303 /DNA_ID=CAMNT_0013035783 /DNA_START=132 /DNA_END=1043 /DNA_ORIENTATION=-